MFERKVVAVSELLSALDQLAAADVQELPDAMRGPELRDLYLARTRLDAEINRRLQVFDARALGEHDGAPSTQSWLRGQCRVAPGEASGEVQLARGLRAFPTVATAWQAGEINRDHARAVTMLAKETSVEATQNVTDKLLAVARLADPLRFSAELRKWREAWRREGYGQDESSVDARRELVLARSLDGMTAVKGWLTPEVAELMRTALDGLATPAPGETRSSAQRYHDALGDAFRRLLDADEVAPGRKVRPQLLVLCTMEGLIEAQRSAYAELGYGDVVGRDALQRIACDSTVTRVLIGPKGEVLDLGRATRTVTPAQWKALVVRDGGCVVAACDRPATWCEAHHLLWWTRGGKTDLKNLALLCGYHHKLVHDGGWTLLRHSDGRWILRRPDGTEIVDVGAIRNTLPTQRDGVRGSLGAVLHPPEKTCPG